jgi:hypothetical protein
MKEIGEYWSDKAEAASYAALAPVNPMYAAVAAGKAKSAALHLVSAAKWGAIAAAAGGVAGALAGGGGGGGGGGAGGGSSRPDDAPESHRYQYPRSAVGATDDFTRRETVFTVHITNHLDPWNPNNPAHQDTWHKMGSGAVARRGPVEPD